VSRERVRQIEVRAFEKVQSAVKGAIAKQEAATLEAAHWAAWSARRSQRIETRRTGRRQRRLFCCRL